MFGIVLQIWGALAYLAYWIDKLNQISPFRCLPLLCPFSFLPKLEASMDDDSTYYGVKHDNVKLVNHRDMTRIVLIAEVLGLSISSGILYGLIIKIISFVVYKVLGSIYF